MNWTRTRLTIRAWCELARYDVTNTLYGFGGVRRQLIKECGPRRRPQTAAEVCNAVNLAACFYFKQVLCLQRSVVTLRLLRQHGITCQLVIGYRPSPFFAHAWAEIDGQVVNDLCGYQKRLLVLYRL